MTYLARVANSMVIFSASYGVPTASLQHPYANPSLSLWRPYTAPPLSLHCPYTVPTPSLWCPYSLPTLHTPYLLHWAKSPFKTPALKAPTFPPSGGFSNS